MVIGICLGGEVKNLPAAPEACAPSGDSEMDGGKFSDASTPGGLAAVTGRESCGLASSEED